MTASFSKAGEFFKETQLANINERALERYKAWRKKAQGVKDSTLRHDLQALSMLFKYSFRRRWVRTNPTGKPLFPLHRTDPDATVPNSRVRGLSRPAKDSKVSAATLPSVSQQPQTGELQVREADLKALRIGESTAQSKAKETPRISESTDSTTQAIEALADKAVSIIVEIVGSQTDTLSPQLRSRTLQRVFQGARNFAGALPEPWRNHPPAHINRSELIRGTRPDAVPDFPRLAFTTEWVINILAVLVPDRSRWQDILDAAESQLLMPEQRLRRSRSAV